MQRYVYYGFVKHIIYEIKLKERILFSHCFGVSNILFTFAELENEIVTIKSYTMMKVTEAKVKNFATNCYGVFENGEFNTTYSSFDELIQRATILAAERGDNKCTIATLKFTGTDEDPKVQEGTVIMSFTNINGVVYITNQLP